ncbi:unnamed protein product [Effrenium voratum]|uniref:Uncharacterized protein n=1 Tax=Effrenium voratum TaxID=2562239 RepID=A0AA36HNM4_9DINO|nr:unnamed protein product [Effrenium voratum]
MSWGAKEFLKELDDVQKLLAFGAPVAVQDGMIQALWKKIKACNTLLPSDLLAMLQGIKDSALPERSSQFLNENLMMKACSATQAQQDEVYEMSGTFSKLFHDSDIVSPVAPIRVYPALPTELGADWIAQVYGQEKPSMKVLTSLRGLSVGCPVRSTSSLLSRNMAKNVQMDDRDSAQFAVLGKLVGVGQIPVDKSQNEPKITFFNRAKELQNTASSSMSLPALQEMQKIPTPVSSMKASALPESASPGPSTVTAEPSPGHALPSPAEIAIAHAHVPASVAPEPEESAKPPKTEAKVEKAAEGQQIVGKRVRGKQADSNFHATTAKKAKQPPAKKPHKAEQKTKKITGGCLRVIAGQGNGFMQDTIQETLDEDLTISARHLTMASCELATDAELLQSWDRLAQHSQSDNKGTFKMRQQASGWTFSEAALLMSPVLRSLGLLRPATQYCFDYMHGLCSNGVLCFVLFWALHSSRKGSHRPLQHFLETYCVLPEVQVYKDACTSWSRLLDMLVVSATRSKVAEAAATTVISGSDNVGSYQRRHLLRLNT